MDEKKQVCAKKNSIGECIEWKEVGDELIAEFKQEAKECNPELYKEYQRKFVERKIRLNV